MAAGTPSSATSDRPALKLCAPGFEALRNALRRVAPVQSHVCPRSEGTKRGCEDRARAGYIGAVPHLRAGHSARWLRVSLSSAQSIMSLLLPQFDGTRSHFLRADREGQGATGPAASCQAVQRINMLAGGAAVRSPLTVAPQSLLCSEAGALDRSQSSRTCSKSRKRQSSPS